MVLKVTAKGVKITWKGLVSAGVGLFLLGMLVVWSGFINIGATTGHWSVTDWFLHWAMRNSVRTQAALTVDVPAADETGIVSAAGHYAATCALCHGAPGERPSPVMQATLPAAPDLAVNASQWTDEQLFWIIKHGVKFTPMPAWPTQERDDEVARMVAFVRALPGMTTDRYRELAYGRGQRIVGGEAMRMDDALPDCARCHDADGRGRAQPDIPILGGQSSDYLLATLTAYASGERSSGVMGAAAARVDSGALRALAEHYAALPGLAWPARKVAAAPSQEDRQAALIVEQGLPEANLPACNSCHAPGKRPHYPVLAGQKASYLAARLILWRGDATVVDAKKSNAPMAVIARRIPERMIGPLARYYGSP
jgi:cytochrome c553